jgi:hypothetical protein
MSSPAPKPEDDPGPWSDPHVRREEFRRRLAENGIFVGMRETGIEWDVPDPFPVSADEASAMVIRMRRESDH